MKKFGINLQWSKKDAILPLLPEHVIEECKPILRLSEADAGTQIYKDLKTEIIALYGQKDEHAYKQAASLRLTGRPSALGKQLIHKLCPGAKPFETCHCAKIVFGMWHAQLSTPIRVGLAGLKFNKDTYKDVFIKADEIWLQNGGSDVPQQVVAAVTSNSASSAPAPPSSPNSSSSLQVSAASRGRGGRGRGGNNRGGRGRGGYNRGNQNNQNNQSNTNRNNNTTSSSNSSGSKPHQKGQRHPDGPPDSACARHWLHGRGATYCSDPLVCEWVNIIAPRPKN